MCNNCRGCTGCSGLCCNATISSKAQANAALDTMEQDNLQGKPVRTRNPGNSIGGAMVRMMIQQVERQRG